MTPFRVSIIWPPPLARRPIILGIPPRQPPRWPPHTETAWVESNPFPSREVASPVRVNHNAGGLSLCRLYRTRSLARGIVPVVLGSHVNAWCERVPCYQSTKSAKARLGLPTCSLTQRQKLCRVILVANRA